MDSTALKAQIDSQITNETSPNSISPADVGGNLKSVVDYIDQQAPIKSSGSLSLSTNQTLVKDITGLSYSGGEAYLPATTIIGKEYIVFAANDNISVFANIAKTANMIVTYGTFITNVELMSNQMYRFTYLGFGTGTGGTVNGLWKAEQI